MHPKSKKKCDFGAKKVKKGVDLAPLLRYISECARWRDP